MKLKQLVFGVFLLEAIFTGIGAQLEVCGQAPLNARIVKRADAIHGDWPWQAVIMASGALCGGTLISKEWVLSAAHCFQSVSAADITVSFGKLTVSVSEPNSVSRSVSGVIIHPNFDNRTSDNDVALLQLSSPVDFNDFIRPVCLAAEDSVLSDGTLNWVTGYGTTSSGGPIAQSLQEVNVPIVSNSRCNAAHSDGITENMICAGEGGKDSCQGDVGCPMVIKEGSRWVQTGLVSFGFRCAEPGFPGVYTRVSRFQTWINQQIPAGEQPGFITVSANTAAIITSITATTTTITTTTTTTSTAGSTAVTPHLLSLSLPLLMSILPLVFSGFVLS